MRILFIKNKTSFTVEQGDELTNAIDLIFPFKNYVIENNFIYFIFDNLIDATNLNFNLNDELYIDCLYFLTRQIDESETQYFIDQVLMLLDNISHGNTQKHLDNFDLLKHSYCKKMDNKAIKKIIFGPLVNDKALILIIKKYFELNQNSSLTALSLNYHRNTILYQLKRFANITDLKVQEFLVGFYLYHFLINYYF